MTFIIENVETKALNRAAVMVRAIEEQTEYGKVNDDVGHLIADLLLYAESIGVDPHYAIRNALMHYEAERDAYFGEEEE